MCMLDLFYNKKKIRGSSGAKIKGRFLGVDIF